METESNQLDQNFQLYLERRKQNEINNSKSECLNMPARNANESLSTMSSLGKEISLMAFNCDRQLYQPKFLSVETIMDEENDEEFRRMKENLKLDQQQNDIPRSDKSESSTSSLEIRNAILEAKLKFFEHEHTIRQSKEQGEQIRSGNLLQKQLEQYSELNEISEYFNQNFGNHKSETMLDLSVFKDETESKMFTTESNRLHLNGKDEIIDENYQIENSPSIENKTPTKNEEHLVTSARRKLFPLKEQPLHHTPRFVEIANASLDIKQGIRYYEPITMQGKNFKATLKSVSEQKRPAVQVENTSELIKQSMQKMQRLFVQQDQSKETLRELVNNVEQQRNTNREDGQKETNVQAFNRSLSTTLTSTVTNSTSTTSPSASEDVAKLNENAVDAYSKRTRNTVMTSILNLASESEESLYDSSNREMEITADTVIDVEEHKETNENNTEEYGQIKETIESSDLNALIHADRNTPQLSANKDLEKIGQLDSPKLFDLNLSEPDNDKEIGEILSLSNRTFATIETKLSGSISSHSSTDLQISTGKQSKNVDKQTDDDSESDFWA